MAAKNRVDIQTEIDSLLPDNTTGDISPQDVRTVHETAKDSNLNLLETANQTVASKINNCTVSSDQARIGIMDYNDSATAGTPIAIPGTSTFTDIPNDGLGAFTNKTYKVSGVSELWDAGTGLFDWTDLSLGDQVNIRFDATVTTTTANQNVVVQLLMAVGSGGSYGILFIDTTFKSAGTYPLNRFNMVYMGDTTTLNNGAKFQIKSDASATIVVNGWAIQHFLRN